MQIRELALPPLQKGAALLPCAEIVIDQRCKLIDLPLQRMVLDAQPLQGQTAFGLSLGATLLLKRPQLLENFAVIAIQGVP
jgi:hypothetical protein